MGIVLAILFFWNRFHLHFPANKKAHILAWFGEHTTIIYIVQWILICWLLPLFGYQQLSLIEIAIPLIITSPATYTIAYFLIKIKSYAPPRL